MTVYAMHCDDDPERKAPRRSRDKVLDKYLPLIGHVAAKCQPRFSQKDGSMRFPLIATCRLN